MDNKDKTRTRSTKPINPSAQWCTKQKETHSPQGRGGWCTRESFPLRFQTSTLNLSVCWIYLITVVRIFLFSVGLRFLLPYKSISAISEFPIWGRFLNLGTSTGFIVENNSFLWAVKRGHSNRKCSVDSIPELHWHASVGVSLKLWLFLWEFKWLNPTRSW